MEGCHDLSVSLCLYQEVSVSMMKKGLSGRLSRFYGILDISATTLDIPRKQMLKTNLIKYFGAMDILCVQVKLLVAVSQDTKYCQTFVYLFEF